MNSFKYLREGKGTCSKCARERDVVVPVAPIPSFYQREQHLDPVISRHLHQTEVYTPRGAFPNGFCLGSLLPAVVVEHPRHNHPTRDIKKPGQCPACDLYQSRRGRGSKTA